MSLFSCPSYLVSCDVGRVEEKILTGRRRNKDVKIVRVTRGIIKYGVPEILPKFSP